MYILYSQIRVNVWHLKDFDPSMRVKARPGQMDVSRDNLHRKNGAHIWLQQCECMWICFSECMKNSKRFLHFDSFFCRLDQISSLQKDLTQPKRWSIFSKRSNELVICAKILVSEVSGNSLWSHLSLQLHISLHLPVHLTAHPPKAGDAYQNLVIKFDEPGTKLLHKMIFLATSQHGLVVTSRVPVIEDHPSNLMAIISSVGFHIMTSSCDMESLFLYHFQATLF